MPIPGQRYSRANEQLARVAGETGGVTFVDLYAEYPRFKIDVETEQDRLLTHDAIIFQFPLFWYSTPALLKEWQDLVLEYGFAYGEGGDRIAGKLFLPVITAGGPQEFYRTGGRNNYSLRDLLRPLEQTANLCGLNFVPPYTLFAALRATDDDRLHRHADGYARLLKALRNGTLDLETASTMKHLSADDLPVREEARA